MSEPVFDGLSISEHAARAADAVRAVNHLSIGDTADEALPYPSDVSAVVSDLARAARGLPQALAQIEARLARLAATGRVRDASPEPERAGVDPAARASTLLRGKADAAAQLLAALLDEAADCLARLAYDPGPDTGRSPADAADAPIRLGRGGDWPGLAR